MISNICKSANLDDLLSSDFDFFSADFDGSPFSRRMTLSNDDKQRAKEG